MTTMNHRPPHIFVLTALVALLLALPEMTHAAVKATPVTPKAASTPLGSITDALVDTTVEVEAKIGAITPPREGSRAPFRVQLSDETGSLPMIIWPDVFDTIKARTPLQPGATVRVRAKVSTYRDNLQLQIRGPEDIRIVAGATAPVAPTRPAPVATAPGAGAALTPIADINTGMLNRDVTLEGTISDVREPRSERAPYVVTISQDGARLPMVFWSDMHPQVRDKIKVGNIVRVKAQVSEHREQLQLRLRNAADLTVVGVAE